MTSYHQLEAMSIKQLKAKLKTSASPVRDAIATELIMRGTSYASVTKLLKEVKK